MERFLFSRVEVWLVLLLLLLAAVGTVVFGAAVLEHTEGRRRLGAPGEVAVAVARAPATLEAVLKAHQRTHTYRQNASPGQQGWQWASETGGAGLPGYWVATHFDPALRQSVVEMVRLADGEVVHRWQPDFGALVADARRDWGVATGEDWHRATSIFYHVMPLEDGGLLLKSELSPLVRVDACSRLVWLNDQHLFHHTTEPDGEGNFWISALETPATVPGVSPAFRDDAVALVAADGRTLFHRSLVDVFLRNGYEHEVFSPSSYLDDPLHLNDVEPVLADGPHWKKGDLFVSMRHISAVALYRPSTDAIVWFKRGPWIGQHDVDILDDHRIAIYDNDVRKKDAGPGRIESHSDIVVYDFRTDTVTRPHSEVFAREDIRSFFEALYTYLPGGELVVEDHISGRIFIFDAEGQKLGQFTNRVDGTVYMIGWGRFVGEAEGGAMLEAARSAACAAPRRRRDGQGLRRSAVSRMA